MEKQKQHDSKSPIQPAESAVAKAQPKNIVDLVLDKVNKLMAFGELKIPKDYNVENALKSAYLILSETKDKNDKPVLEACTRESIANALLDMVISGFSPFKKQCAFVCYGNKLLMQREYHGTIALAKRYGGVKEVTANVIYQDDIFEYSIDGKTGLKSIVKHEQKFENIDENKIKGSYAVVTFEEENKQPFIEIMNIFQIRTSWNQGYAKGNSPAHQRFPSEMAKKTVINRACKLFISTSDDEDVYIDNGKSPAPKDANKEDLRFDEVEEIATNQPIPEKTENPITPDNATPPDAGMEQAAREFEQQEAMKYQKKGPGF